MKPQTKRLTRKAINITIHPTVLAMVDKRSGNGNRSEQITLDLARYYTITAGKGELTRTESARMKALTTVADMPFVTVVERADRFK